MSRIGKRPIAVAKGIQVDVKEGIVSVKGGKGHLHFALPDLVQVAMKDGQVLVTRTEETAEARARHGVVQSQIQNMVQGVADGFSKDLEIQGVGFRAEMKGQNLQLSLGFSHPVLFPIPHGIQVKVTNQTKLTIEGCDKALVGQIAANIRDLKPPEPYQGKGIRYAGEVVRRKVGKAAAGAAGG